MDRFTTPLGFTWDARIFPKIDRSADIDRQIARACFRAKKIFPELVYNTTALEDNPFTFPEVQTLLEGITVGGHRLEDQQQVLNQAASWRFLIEKVSKKEFSVTREMLCTLHSLVAKEEALAWGVFRDGDVRIAGTDHRPPKASELDWIFQRGIAHLNGMENALEKGITASLFGSLNQFFWDGNKRASRLFMNGILMSAGFDAINIPARLRLDFNTKMIRFYDSKDGTEMAELLLSLSDIRPT